jgi:TusA-related sulfurtransferase
VIDIEFDVHGMMPQRVCDLGNMTVGPELFLIMKKELSYLQKGELLEISSRRPGIREDILSWCRLTRNACMAVMDAGERIVFLIRKGDHFPGETPDWGIRVPRRPDGSIHLSDMLQGKFGLILEVAPKYLGFVPRGSVYEESDLEEDIWADNLGEFYESAKQQQWNATTDIPWDQLPPLPDDLERAVCQLMTFLAENEYSALYIPLKFMSRIHAQFVEPLLFLSTVVYEEARHIEAFTKRALANGGGLQHASALTERSLHSLLIQENYFHSSFMLHVLGEGTFLDLLKFIEDYAPDPVTRRIVQLARNDEGRHVGYGISHVRRIIAKSPGYVRGLIDVVEERREYVDAASGSNLHVTHALAVLAGGGSAPAQIGRGMKRVRQLYETMHLHRMQRLLQTGLPREAAERISRAHTPNFM